MAATHKCLHGTTLFQQHHIHDATLKLSAPRSAAADTGDRVLPFIGLSSVGMVAAVAHMGCSKEHMGGTRDKATKQLCIGTLTALSASSGLHAFKIRLDPHVRLLVGSHHSAGAVATGI